MQQLAANDNDHGQQRQLLQKERNSKILKHKSQICASIKMMAQSK
jgi:hypothetical protein